MTTPRASESRQRVVSFYGTIGSYALQRAVPSPIARPETLIHGQEGRVNTGWPSPYLVQKVSICDTNHQVQGRATTGEASEYLKKTSVRDLFVMADRTRKISETMSHSVQISALWALKVALEVVCRFGHHIPGLGANVRRLLSPRG